MKTNTAGAVAVQRGCGVRYAGGVYLETTTAPGGRPLEEFLLDPPHTVPDDLNLPPIGVLLVERDKVHHVVDRVGSMHYENVMDFIEEARRFGVSRRVPKNLKFETLSEGSRLILAHSQVILKNAVSYWDRLKANTGRTPREICPRSIDHLVAADDAGKTCMSHWLHTVDLLGCELGENGYRRVLPSFSYDVPDLCADLAPQWGPVGFFATLPLSRVVVVKGDDSSKRTFDEVSLACRDVKVEMVDQ